MRVSNQMILEAMEDLQFVHYSSRELAVATKCKHLRSGKISAYINRKLAGLKVHALGFDELGNMIYIAKDGLIRMCMED